MRLLVFGSDDGCDVARLGGCVRGFNSIFNSLTDVIAQTPRFRFYAQIHHIIASPVSPPPPHRHHPINIASIASPGEQREDQLLALRQRPAEGVRTSERGDVVRRGGRQVGVQRRAHAFPRGVGAEQAEAHRAHGGHGEFFAGGGNGGRGENIALVIRSLLF